jgi:hypothetical protein
VRSKVCREGPRPAKIQEVSMHSPRLDRPRFPASIFDKPAAMPARMSARTEKVAPSSWSPDLVPALSADRLALCRGVRS